MHITEMAVRSTAWYCIVGMYVLVWFSRGQPASDEPYQRVTADYDAFIQTVLDRGAPFSSLLSYIELEEKLVLVLLSLKEISASHPTGKFNKESQYTESVNNLVQVLIKEIGSVKSNLDIAQYALAQVTPMKNQCLENINHTTEDGALAMLSDACQLMYTYIKVYNGFASLLANVVQLVDRRKSSIVSASSHLERIIGELKNDYPSEMEKCEVLADNFWANRMDILQFFIDILIDEPHLPFEEALLKAHVEFMQHYDTRQEPFGLKDADNTKGTMFIYANNFELPEKLTSRPYDNSTRCQTDESNNFIYKLFKTKKCRLGISESQSSNNSFTRLGMIVASVL